MTNRVKPGCDLAHEAGWPDAEEFEFALNPQFLLRTCGLPIDAADALRFTATVAWAAELMALEDQLARRTDPLVDVLEDAIAACEDRKVRCRLLDLKRDVFNVRPPRKRAALRNVLGSLDTTLTSPIEEWIALWEKQEQMEARGAVTFSQELAQKRATLKNAVRLPDFRKGILLASPSLDQAIDTYCDADNLELNKRERATERTLVKYVLRAACKTSPFSTFTSVCPGVLDGAGDGAISYEFEGMEKRSFAKLNIAMLSGLTSRLISSDEVRPELPVRVTPGCHRRNGRIRYLRRRLDAVTDDTSPILDFLHEDIFFLPATQLLDDLLAVLNGERVVRFADLVDELVGQPGHERPEEEVAEYLRHLLRLGMLINPDLRVNIHSDDPLADYRHGMARIKVEPVARAVPHLDSLGQIVSEYPEAGVDGRRERLQEIVDHVREIHRILEGGQGRLPSTIVYEDTTIQPRNLAIHPERWGGILPALAELQRVLPIFDVNMERRLVTKGYFRARWGRGERCDDVLEFADRFNLEFFEQFLDMGMRIPNLFDDKEGFIGSQNHLRLAEIDSLNQGRQAIADYVSRAYDRLPPGCEELVLDRDFVDAVAPHVPRSTMEFQAYSYFAQYVESNGQPLLILNRVYTGLTAMFSRFSHCFPEQDGYRVLPALRQTLRDLQPPGTIFAELRGGYDTTNLNLHPHLADYELICPGDLATRPADRQIPLQDLYIQDDLEADVLRLYSKRLQKQIIPIYLGFLVPLMLPEIQQVLLNFSHPVMCQIYLWLGAGVPSKVDTIAFLPRIRYRNLVLHRAQWKLNPGYFPVQGTDEADPAYFVRVNRWRLAHGIPTRVFVTSEALPAEFSDEEDPGMKPETYKPLYVDFESYFSVDLLQALVRKSPRQLVLNEMLPHRDDLWLQAGGQSYVTEFILESTRVRRK